MTVPTRITISHPDDMHALGHELGTQFRAGDLVLLTGPLGAGKTTLTRGIGDGLHVRGPVTSPTFVLARTHPSLTGGPSLIHVDAYRLADSSELEDLDLDFARSVIVAEWGDGLVDTGDSWLHVVIERPVGDVNETGDPADETWDEEPIEPREVTLTRHGSRWDELQLSKQFYPGGTA